MATDFRENRKLISKAWEDWAEEKFKKGCDLTHLSFMFKPQGASERAIVEGMKREVETFYRLLVSRFNKWPTKAARTMYNPSLIWFPDRPDAKSKRVPVEVAKINGGLHGHGLLIAFYRPQTNGYNNGWDVIHRDQAVFCRNGIANIDANKVTHNPRWVASYASKSIRAGFFKDEDVLVFPRTLSELSDRANDEYWREAERHDFKPCRARYYS